CGLALSLDQCVPIRLKDALRLIDRQWAQDNGIKDRENRRVRPDPQRQRKRRNYGEAGALRQHTRSVTQVLPEFSKEPYATSVATPILRLFHSAESLASRVARLLRTHPQADILLGLLFDVMAQFFIQFALD